MEKNQDNEYERKSQIEVDWTDHGESSWEYVVAIQGIGQIACDVRLTREGEVRVFRHDFEVNQQHQGQGYGKRLMEEALAVAKSCGATHVVGEADSPRTVGIIRDLLGDGAVVARDYNHDTQGFSDSTGAAQAIEYLAGSTTQDPDKEGYRSLVIHADITQLAIEGREAAPEHGRPPEIPVVAVTGREHDQVRESPGRDLEADRSLALKALQQGLRIGQELVNAREVGPGGNDTSEQSQTPARVPGEAVLAQALERNASDSSSPGPVVGKDAPGTELARVVAPSEPGKTAVVQELADTAHGLVQGVEPTTQVQVVEVQTGRTPGGEVPVVERSLADQLFELAREAERIGNSAPRIVPTPLQTRSLKDKVLGKIPGLKREAPTHNESLLRHPNQMTQEERQRIIDVRLLERSGVKDSKARTIARGISLEGPARDVFEAAVQQRAAALLAQNPNHVLGKDAVAERTELARQQVLMGMAIVTKQVQDRADNLALEGRNTALAVEAARNQKNTPTVEQVLNLLNKGRVTPEEQRRHLELEARALVRESPGLGIEQAKELLLEQRRIEMNNAPSRGRGAPGVEKGIDLGRGR